LPDRTTDEDAVLTGSLEALANLSVGSLDLTDMLTQVATLAVRAIPGADGAGLTLLEIDRADLIVKSEPFVRAIDDIQYSIGEGPCISAAATGQTRRSGRLSDDSRWRVFGPRASELGVHSALSLPPGFWVRSTSTPTPWTPSTTTPRSAARHSPCQRP
jgi:hypothetical protein